MSPTFIIKKTNNSEDTPPPPRYLSSARKSHLYCISDMRDVKRCVITYVVPGFFKILSDIIDGDVEESS